MSDSYQLPQLNSLKTGNIFIIVTALILLAVAAFAAYYVFTEVRNEAEYIKAFLSNKNQILRFVPFILVLLIFFLSLYTYTVYVDYFNLFPRFEHKPTNAMLLVILPIINLYGIGMAYSRLINYLDVEDDAFYEKQAFGLKVSLSLVYAGMFGILLTLLPSFEFQNNVQQFQKAGMPFYYALQFLLMFICGAGLIALVIYNNKILRHRWQYKIEQELLS